MHLSKYCKIYPNRETLDTYLVYSTKQASSILATKALLNDIEQGSLNYKERDLLMKHGFLVHSLEDERQEMLNFMSDINSYNNRLTLLAVMNLDCNLSCKYCFEGNRKGKYYMNRKTADLLVDFIKRNGSCKKEIKLIFYGGEPLLSADMIVYISEKVKKFADENNIDYSFSLVTNGVLLNRHNTERLVPLGFKAAKVTVDGPKNIHDVFRPFKRGDGSFNTIINNLKEVCSSVNIQIGGNFTEENYRSFPWLLEYMLSVGLTPDRISVVKFVPIINETSKYGLPDFRDGCESINEPWLFEALMFLREAVLKSGYKTDRPKPAPCTVEVNDFAVVNYNGTLYKCPGLIGRRRYSTGTLTTGLKDCRKSHNLDNYKNERCLECSYLPLCFGGCRYMKLLRDGTMKGVDCKKPYYDAVLEHLIRQDLRYGIATR